MNGIENILKEKKAFITTVCGDSMFPLLREGKDRVIITSPELPLKKYDVAVYRRNGHYTMHRIIRTTKTGYLICGDNRTNIEKDITDKDIVGDMSYICRDGKIISVEDNAYISYSKKVVRTLPLRIIKKLMKML